MNSIIDTMFLGEIKELVNSAKQRVVTSINIAMVYTYYEIGKRIVEQEQKGKHRANYGNELIKQLSAELTREFGKGYSEVNLRYFRKFYIIYSVNQIQQTMFAKSKIIYNFNNYPITSDGHRFFLNWASYILLMRIKDPNERSFYEIECYNSNWSFRELKRQIDSCLYERLCLSRDKQGVLDLSRRGQIIEKPADVLKEPVVLEFLNLEENEKYSESDLESAIISKIKLFLLELGKGFIFVQRQMRMSFNGRHYHADLVFYNRFLRCFVIVDLKIGEITHQDIGQMQMYVNYYDRFVKSDEENKTIGILLCKEKDDAFVRLTLPEDNNQIFATKHETILPTKEELIQLLMDK